MYNVVAITGPWHSRCIRQSLLLLSLPGPIYVHGHYRNSTSECYYRTPSLNDSASKVKGKVLP